MATFEEVAAPDIVRLLHGDYDGVFFSGRSSAAFRAFIDKVRQLPVEPPPLDMARWWSQTEGYRGKFELELRAARREGDTSRERFLQMNHRPAELADGADVVGPFFIVPGYWQHGRIQNADEVVSGVICYGEWKNLARHSLADIRNLVSALQSKAA